VRTMPSALLLHVAPVLVRDGGNYGVRSGFAPTSPDTAPAAPPDLMSWRTAQRDLIEVRALAPSQERIRRAHVIRLSILVLGGACGAAPDAVSIQSPALVAVA